MAPRHLIDAIFGKSAKLSPVMPFRFKKKESPSKAVRRVCRERVGAARKRLRKSDRPAAIHGARREIKKLRAVFRLVRGEIGRSAYRKGVDALRAAADFLAAPRDARVTLKAFRKLAGHARPRFAGIEEVLREHCRRETRRFQKRDAAAAADRILRKTDRRAGGLRIKSVGWSAIEPGLKESYRRGREACALVHRKPSAENFHEWRKQVKNLWHYFLLLRPAWPAEIRAMTEELELLGRHLGDEHDLFLLEQFVAKHCTGQGGEAAVLKPLIKSRQKTLRTAALKLGSRLYAEPPEVLCRKLRQCWDLWRRK